MTTSLAAPPAPPTPAPPASAAPATSVPPTPRPPAAARSRFAILEAALPFIFLLLVALVAAGFMALFLSGS
ncbi:hypothetical protein FK529_15040 [Tsukamurella asaccharolytica]|uniref:ABC transporter permease n=1 Tax=Tsukamurella asaccharolytica TaxID=2592067 RepID=A0A5C5R862_9ACTN|nr:hypothetical protein [Tsukamurella asaccharolytica]TWS18624.1 hypothetical protein FK529_15040 [Tsukamurella asaccharolytica]